MGKIRVVYTVTYECDVVWGGGESREDAIRDIDIPEGGANASVYCEGSFDVVEVHDPKEDE